MKGFLKFSGSTEKDQWHERGLKKISLVGKLGSDIKEMVLDFFFNWGWE